MTEQDLELLRASVGKVIRIVCHDGEHMLARVHAVSDEDKDVIYDVVSTTKESRYEKHDEQPAYLMKFEDIEHVEPYLTS